MANMEETEVGGTSEEVIEVVADLSRPDVAMKYRTAAGIADAALELVLSECVEGKDIFTLCRLGDKYIEDNVAGIHNKKVKGEVPKKGVSFPTSISVNEICGHFSPLKGDPTTLKKGDVCKVDLGCHVDGFIALVAHTIIVPDAEGKITDDTTGTESSVVIKGRKADVVMAAWTAAEAAARQVKEGASNKDVTKVITTAAESYRCVPVRGVLSHQMKQHVIDGNQVIIGKETADEKVDEFTFNSNEVYGIDIIVSTGEGKPKETELRTTIYKRDLEQNYKLKTHTGRKFIHDVNTRYPTLPFSANAFEEESSCKVGISECMRHSLLVPYPVVSEKVGEYVAQFKFTVLLLPGGAKKVSGLPLKQSGLIKSEYSVTDKSLLDLLSTPLGPVKKKSKSKNKATDDKPN